MDQRWGSRLWAACGSLFVVLGLVVAALSGSDGRSPQVPTASPTPVRPADPLSDAAAWVPAVSTGEPAGGLEPAVDATSTTGAAAEPQAPTGGSTDSADTADTVERPTFLQVDRYCSASTVSTFASSPSAGPVCPAQSTTTDLWQAAAHAGVRGPSMFVSASARAPAGTLVPTAQASATWSGRALRESLDGGPVRVHLTGVSGEVGGTCDDCVLTDVGTAQLSVDVSYVGADGDMVRQWSSCWFLPGEPVPTSLTVPDDCIMGEEETLEVPPRTPVWVELRLWAHATTQGASRASADLDVASATLDMP